LDFGYQRAQGFALIGINTRCSEVYNTDALSMEHGDCIIFGDAAQGLSRPGQSRPTPLFVRYASESDQTFAAQRTQLRAINDQHTAAKRKTASRRSLRHLPFLKKLILSHKS
jgi:hypothetical protein